MTMDHHCVNIVTWILGLCAYVEGSLGSRQMSQEESLFTELFLDYNPSARPVIDSTRTVSVAIQFSLLHIKELDVRSQVLTTTGLLILEWHDERLIWDPQKYDNISEIILEAKKLWRPEFAAINGAEKIYDDYDNFRAIINYNGTVRWEPGGVFQTMCQIDITYYPFDDQKCDLIFGAWSYHTSKMNLSSSSTTINLDSYKVNGEWLMLGTKAERREFNYECCPDEKFANVVFAVYIRRRHTFYIMNVILPSILTSVLLLSIFFCTPGQKVQIGVVVLLSFRIFLLNVADNIPKTSDHIPLLGVYLTCTMAITTLSMVLTVFVLNLHHIEDRPVPRLVKQIVLFYMAHLLGVNVKDRGQAAKCCRKRGVSILKRKRKAKSMTQDRNQDQDKSLTFANRNAIYQTAAMLIDKTPITPDACSSGSGSSSSRCSTTVLGRNGSNNCHEHITMIRMEPKLLNGGANRTKMMNTTVISNPKTVTHVSEHKDELLSQNSMPAHSMPAHSMSPHGMPAHGMPAHGMPAHSMPVHKDGDEDSVFLDNDYVADISDADDNPTDEESYTYATEDHDVPEVDFSKDWKKIAEVFDRLFFWLFLLAIFISTLILFHPLTDSYIRGRPKIP